ncbi:MAG TPA: hypothetical protein GX392_00930 [Clostridiales bacterium]|nr:hypothetical protein [Clostridiales bacterium]
MFIDVYTAIVLWTFAIFGMVLFVLKLYQHINYSKHIDREKLSIIISAKNQQDVLEGIVRGFILKAGLDSMEDMLLNIVLVDVGSSDETLKIMKKLGEDYCFIKLLKPDELSSYLKSM